MKKENNYIKDKPNEPIKDDESYDLPQEDEPKPPKEKVSAVDNYFSHLTYYNDFISKKAHNRIFKVDKVHKKTKTNKQAWAGLLNFLNVSDDCLKYVTNDSNENIADTLMNKGVIKEYGRITEFKYLLGYLVNRGPFIFSDKGKSFLVYGVNTDAETFFTSKGQVLFSVIKKKINDTQNYGISAIIS